MSWRHIKHSRAFALAWTLSVFACGWAVAHIGDIQIVIR